MTRTPRYTFDERVQAWSAATIASLVEHGATGNLEHPKYTHEQMLTKVRLANRRLAQLRWPWYEDFNAWPER